MSIPLCLIVLALGAHTVRGAGFTWVCKSGMTGARGKSKKQWEWGIRGWNVCFSGDKQARKREIVLGAGLSGFFLLWGYLEEAKAATKEVE